MLAAQILDERTGDEHWLEAWQASADVLWKEWRGDFWTQDGRPRRGPLSPGLHCCDDGIPDARLLLVSGRRWHSIST
jgi:hypothetical protein